MTTEQIRQAGERRKTAWERLYRARPPQQGLKASQQHGQIGWCCHSSEEGPWGRGAAELGLGDRDKFSCSFCGPGVKRGWGWVSLSLTYCPIDPNDPLKLAPTVLGVWCESSMQPSTGSCDCSKKTSLASPLSPHVPFDWRWGREKSLDHYHHHTHRSYIPSRLPPWLVLEAIIKSESCF